MATARKQVEDVAAEPEAPAPQPQPTETELRRQAYTAAVGRLKEAHRDEFRALVQEEAGNRGVTYEFRKTDEEKAAEQVKDLLAKFPHLAETLQPQG